MTTTEPSRNRQFFEDSVVRPDDTGLADSTTTDLFEFLATAPTVDATDPVSSRRALRDQIDALEQRLSALLSEAHCLETTEASRTSGPPIVTGPRMLSLGDLEAVRDALVARIDAVRDARALHDDRIRRNRALLIEMYADPGSHRGVLLTKADLGELGCKRWRVAPALGPVGRMMGWWRVVVSSGCP